MSLSNAFGAEDVADFVSGIRRYLGLAEGDAAIAYVAEPKIDGVSLALRYEDGALVRPRRAATGARARTSRPTPAPSPTSPKARRRAGGSGGARRGLHDHADFAALNARQAEAGAKVFANPRNAAAGSLRQLDSSVITRPAAELLRLCLGRVSEPLAETQSGALERLAALGFRHQPADALAPRATR
jgi:DNA ligase (NAD+)